MKKEIMLPFLFLLIVMSSCTSTSEENVEYYNNPTHVRNIFVPKKPPQILTLKDMFISAEDTENILVKVGNEELSIKKPENYIYISQGEISHDGNYVAFQIGQHEGEKIIVVDVKNGKIRLISNQETVLEPRWSPNKNVLAISIGSIAHQQLALYDPKMEEIQTLTDDYVSVLAIKWEKNGRFIDFVAEHSPDLMLYRYDLDSKKVKEIKEITPSEIIEWEQQ